MKLRIDERHQCLALVNEKTGNDEIYIWFQVNPYANPERENSPHTRTREEAEAMAKEVCEGLAIIHQANAQLIAAAPDLLAACEMAIQDSTPVPGKVYHGPGLELKAETINAIRAAIAKATGE